MRGKTRNLTESVRQAFLALPDDILLAKVTTWGVALGDGEDVWDGLVEYYRVMGYRCQSAATTTIYPTLGELWEAEPEIDDWTMLPPTPETIRQAVTQLHSSEAYHLLAGWMGEVLEHTPLTQAWGSGPDSMYGGSADSYDFLRYLAGYLRTLANQASPAPAATPLLSQQDFSALCGFLQSEDGYHFTAPGDEPSDEDLIACWDGEDGPLDYWQLHAMEQYRDRLDHPRPAITPETCFCDGAFHLTPRWLVAHGYDAAPNLAALQELGAACDCRVVLQVGGRWPGPELRPPPREWNPFDRPKKKKKQGQKQKQKAKR